MPGESLRERLPSPFPIFDDSATFEAWVDAHEADLDRLEDQIDTVEDEIHVDTATGLELDLIGREYGILGQRRGRSDPAYQSYLISLYA
ncbi:MAG: hypothetical protein SV760_05930, partial [Halobacteria archaeon]|nr:hypothetical protein [Halobacteria archaeon]